MNINDVIVKMYEALQSVKLHFEHEGVTNQYKYRFYDAMEELDEMMKPVIITPEMVHELRSKTGEGLMACHKALLETKGSVSEAAIYLRNN